jgi:DeoR family glycerol-3-phosphate regulon repressor
VVLVTDSSKFSRRAPVRIGRLDEIDVLVIDRLPSPEIAEMCRRMEIEVIETGGGPEED